MAKTCKAALEIFKELSFILDKKQKKRAIIVLFVIIVSSGFELMGVTAVLPFIQAVVSPEKIMGNLYVAKVTGFLGIESSQGVLIAMGTALIAVYLVKNIYMIFSYFVQYNYGTRVQKELCNKLLRAYMSRSYSYFLDINSAEIMRACNDDINGVYCILSYLMVIMSESLSVIMIGLFIIYTDPLIAFGVLTLMLVVFLGILGVFKPFMKRAGKKNIEAITEKNKVVYQSVMGIKEIFVMQRKEYFLDDFEEVTETVRKTQRVYDVVRNSPERIVEGICVSGLIGIVCIRLSAQADMVQFIPKLGAFAMAAFKILPSIGKIANRMTEIIYQRPKLSNMYQVISEAKQYEEEHKKYAQSHGVVQEPEELQFKNCLAVKNVFWQYNNQKDYVLQDAELKVHKGESVAFIGASGAGKTTLADIILGLLRPVQGMVEMDGIDIYAMPKTWANIIGYVPQSVFLSDDTIRNNVAFGLKVKDGDDDGIWEALEKAQLKDFVKSLPDKLDTIVGERGIKFSGGQKQRIAIARALYNRPQILVLDEATAALDNDTESAVMDAIESLQGQITLIIVAHRLTTIKNCDVIYEIKNGKALRQDKREVLETAGVSLG